MQIATGDEFMTNRERVLTSLRHAQPDRTPYHIDFTRRAWQATADYLGESDFADRLGNCFTIFDAGPQAWRQVTPAIQEDPFGVQWDQSIDPDIGVVCNTRVTPDTLEEYIFPEIPRPALPSMPDRAAQFVCADLGFSLFERAWTLVGMETLLMAMADDPAFAHRLLDRILEFNLQVIDRACALDIDAMRFGDDWGQQTGLIMGPALWREYIKPRVREMYARVKAQGKVVMIHSCGKVDAVFPDLIDIGLDIFNPFQPEVIDPFRAKEMYGRDLTFYGGISTQRTLPFGTPDQVRDEVRRLLDVVGKDGGFIASPAHAIPADARPDNIVALLEVLLHQ